MLIHYNSILTTSLTGTLRIIPFIEQHLARQRQAVRVDAARWQRQHAVAGLHVLADVDLVGRDEADTGGDEIDAAAGAADAGVSPGCQPIRLSDHEPGYWQYPG